jgi:hypothetical protein
MGEHPRMDSATWSEALDRMDWSEIHQAGCYLHLVSGLLARVFDGEPTENRGRFTQGRVGAVVRLSENPHAPITLLREVAASHGLKFNS